MRIDYTKKRLNSVVRSWTYRKPDGGTGTGSTRIRRCPKCGRKGEEVVYRQKSGEEQYRTYTHGSEVSELIPGFPVNRITNQCTVPTAKEDS